MLPRLSTNIVYYKRDLNMYSVGVYSGKTETHCFYVRLEHEGGRGAQEIGSVLAKHIKSYVS